MTKPFALPVLRLTASTLFAVLLLQGRLHGGPAAEAETKAGGHSSSEQAAPAEADPSVPTPSTPAPPDHAAAPVPAPAANHGDHAEPAQAAEPAAAPPDASIRVAEAEGVLRLAEAKTESGEFADAELAYRQILQNPAQGAAEQSTALLGLARMFRKKTEYTKAAAIYEKFLKVYDHDARVPDALLELGRTQRAMGASRAAINRFYSVINSTLKVPTEGYDHYQLLAKTAQFEIAETHFESGNYTEAGKFFARLRLLDLAPADRARAHFKSAYALMLDGALEKSVVTLHAYLDQWPQDVNVPEARYLLANTLRRLGRKQEALDVTLTLLRTQQSESTADPAGWAYWQRRTGNQLANDFFQSGDTLNAVAIYEGLAGLSDQPGWRLPITYQVALCYERLRQVARARSSYQGIVDAVAGLPEPSAEFVELSRMAVWRMGQLEWSDATARQLTSFLGPATVGSAEPASPPTVPPAHEPNGSPAAASPTL